MNIDNLWNKIDPLPDTVDQLKRDLKEGKVPELPYFIVDMNEAKEKIGDYIKDIDISFQTCLVTANYGNGKTNLIKYLKLFYNRHDKIKVVFLRADVDQYDLIMFLLKIVQDNFLMDLKDSITQLREKDYHCSGLVKNFDDGFAAIQDYVNILFKETDDVALTRLIYLGTGRLYTKRSFGEFGLDQLSNFNRREVLILFLNILSACKIYLIFGIDEIEKIQEKSRIRFGHFLTSYRELYDLSSLIKGHLLITCFTDSAGQSTQKLEEVNPAFFRRIEDRVVELPLIAKIDDLKELITNLDRLFETRKQAAEINKIVSKVKRVGANKNSEIVKLICAELLQQPHKKSFDELLKQNNLKEIFDDTKQALQLENSFSRIHSKFFDPLQEYLIANSYGKSDFMIKAQGSQLFIDKSLDRNHLFLFTTDFDSNFERVLNIKEESDNMLIIYIPERLDINYSYLHEHDVNDVEIIDYNPEDLMTLLVLFRDENFEYGHQIKSVISEYTNNNL